MRKGDAKRQAILDVAEKLFYSKGYEATTVQDILDVLGTSKGSFYHHFESKEQVLATLCTQRAEKAIVQSEASLASLLDPLERLNMLFSYFIPLRRGEEKFLSLLFPLLSKPEGLSLRVCYQDALRQSFLPLMQQELANCRKASVIFALDNPCLPGMVLDLLNQCWMDIARELLHAVDSGLPLEPGALIEILDMHRFVFERILDAPFGSIQLLDVNAMLTILRPVLLQLKLPMNL